MASTTDVANLALGRLRVAQAIASLTDESTPARICSRFMDQCRQEVLRAFPWNFSLKPIALSQVADQTFPGWTYVYAYPSNCIMVRAVSDENGMRLANQFASCNQWDRFNLFFQNQPWQLAIKDDGASRVILSDVPNAWAFHTTDVTAVGLMPPDFVSVWAWRLAAEVGGPLQADDSRISKAEQSYGFWLSTAAAQSMNESKDDPQQDSPSIQCRN